jgi:hypothetical protein
MSDMTVPLWFYFATLIVVTLWASYLCGRRLAKVISLADSMAEAIEDQINVCDASMDEEIAVKNYRTTLAELKGQNGER